MKKANIKDVKLNKKKTQEIREKAKQSHGKVKITINFDANLIDDVKEMAEKQGTPYQTLLNKLLQDALTEKQSNEDRLERLEKEVENLKRLIG